MSRIWRITLALLLAVAALPLTGVQAQSSGVSDARYARLARGANLPGWFWYAPESLDDVAHYFDAQDFATLHRLGFTCVRIPIDFEMLYDAGDPDLLRDDMLAVFDQGLDLIQAADLAVIVDLHSTSLADSDASIYSGALENDGAFVETFIRFWQSFAAHLAVRDPELIFFEPMNEPVFQDDPSRWPPLQARLLAAIRDVAPDHTLIATGALWSGIDTLLDLTPLDDPNIVYNFHFYEPFLFTHQSAEWSWWVTQALHGIPYPSSPEVIAPLLDDYDDAEVRANLVQYGDERWDAARLDQRVGAAAAWAQQHGVRVICDEFGAYNEAAPAADRVQWYHDLRTAFDHYGIGWTVWDYYGEFGPARRDNGGIFIDLALAEALGLSVTW